MNHMGKGSGTSDERVGLPLAGAGNTSVDLLQARKEKLAAIEADGINAFPYSYEGTVAVEVIQARYTDLSEDTDTDERYRVAGRIAARRGQGKIAFIDLIDRSGKIQLQSKVDVLGEDHQRLIDLDLGDIIGAEGLVCRTKRGELSLRLESFELLAKTLRPPPDKLAGLQDTETRYRQRELDLMSNAETRARFIARAKIIRGVRGYLDDAGFIEVETPILQPLYGGAAAKPFTSYHNSLDQNFYLRIAPELYLKRCIVGGLERVYEVGKDFRNEGLSKRHNPEFTMLEWYEAYADYQTTAHRAEELVRSLAGQVSYQGDIDFDKPFGRETLREAIAGRAGIDIMEYPEAESLRAAATERGLTLPEEIATWPQMVDEIVSKHVEPALVNPTFLMDYPKELSPFAKTHREDDRLTERFELVMGGMEVANAFTELNDPREQRKRLLEQAAYRQSGDDEAPPYDESFIRALEYGMPPTGGIGIGIDRITMLLTNQETIREVVLFPTLKHRPQEDNNKK